MPAPTYEKLTPPRQGTRVTVDAGGRWSIPDDPIVCLMRGDGIGRDVGAVPGITTCAARVLDAAVEKAYKGKRRLHWFDVHAGDVARAMYYPQVKDEQINSLSEEEQRRLYLPDDSLKAFEYYSVGLKGPLTTPIGGGFRSINVYLRMRFDLYACVRPVRYFKGVEAPNKRADKVNMVIFREHTEDVYCGIEFKGGSDKGKLLIKDRIPESMFQQIQLRPDEYSVIATPNLNGDYLSDAAAAMTGGIGLAAGANIGDRAAMFEATHGTAPKYTGKNMANPGAVLLSGVLLLEHLKWDEAARLVNGALEATFAESEATAVKGPGGKLYVTYDIARHHVTLEQVFDGVQAFELTLKFTGQVVVEANRLVIVSQVEAAGRHRKERLAQDQRLSLREWPGPPLRLQVVG